MSYFKPDGNGNFHFVSDEEEKENPRYVTEGDFLRECIAEGSRVTDIRQRTNKLIVWCLANSVVIFALIIWLVKTR